MFSLYHPILITLSQLSCPKIILFMNSFICGLELTRVRTSVPSYVQCLIETLLHSVRAQLTLWKERERTERRATGH